MKEPKDIKLKSGDRVYCKDALSENELICIITNDEAFTNNFLGDITKIERPVKYETIYEAPKQILDQKEKEYLEAVIRPFRERMKYIKKCKYSGFFEFLQIQLINDYILLPKYYDNTMYKGMELGKEYTLKELGLFKE